MDSGIHIHARAEARGDKVIDKTFKQVSVQISEQFIEINEEDAVCYNICTILGVKLTYAECSNCGAPYRTPLEHLLKSGNLQCACARCHAPMDVHPGEMCNPLMQVKALVGDSQQVRPLQTPKRTLALDESVFPGGVQIWGSNPAIIWSSAARTEEEGIHIHAYDAHGARVVDDTFGQVQFNQKTLDSEQVRVLMAQRRLPWLAGRLHSLTCPVCREEQFDAGAAAYLPSARRICWACGATIDVPDGHAVVSNPLVHRLRPR